MCHDAGVLAYTLASWHRFRKMAPFSVTTHEFSMKVLRRGRSIQLREMSTIPHFIVNSSLFTVIARNTFTVIARLHRSRGNLLTTTLTVIAGSTFTVIARLHLSRGNLIHSGREIATSLSLLAMTVNRRSLFVITVIGREIATSLPSVPATAGCFAAKVHRTVCFSLATSQ